MDGHKESQETSNSDKLNNLELWGVNVDFKSYQNKWKIDAILQHMGFYSPTENPCVMMRENLKTKSYQYIVICQMIYILYQQHLKKFSLFYKTNATSLFI